MKELVTGVACKKCGKVISITSEKIKMDEFYSSKTEQYYQVMYIRCDCGNLQVLQIDNTNTLEVLETLKSILLDVTKKREFGDVVSKKEKRRAERINRNLDRMRVEIKKELSDEILSNKMKSIVILV